MKKEFVEMLSLMGGPFAALPDVLTGTGPEISVRVNPAKGGKVPAGVDRVAWCGDGYYLAERPQFTFDPALHQGLYYVQDASSMAQAAAVARAVGLLGGGSDAPLRYLDACAAPGGKTTAAISALPEGSFVVANEFDPRRTSILAENLAKWGAPVVVTRGDAARLDGLDGFFDLVAADVPCSGEGMMRKDAQAVAQWSPALVAECTARQRDIVDNLWKILRPGGIMIYSTCTFNLDEDERVVEHIIGRYGAEPVDIPALSRPDILGAAGGFSFPAYRFFPGQVRGEGLFLAMLRKPGDVSAAMPGIRPKSRRANSAKAPKTVSVPDVLTGDWRYDVAPDGCVTAIPAAHAGLADAVGQSCRVVVRGIMVGEIKGKDFIPAQPLAMAQALRREIFPEVEVGKDLALAYLRREAVALPGGTPRGIVLLTYSGAPLGFVKNLGTRANNLYPQQWRILSQNRDC